MNKTQTKRQYKSAETRAKALANLRTDGTPTHGMSKTPIYTYWMNMKSRCDNPKDKSFKDYGSRGISYCTEWKKFENFYADMGTTWERGLTLERVDVNGSYCKENCTWTTRYQQSINKTNTNMLEHNGEKMTISDWARKLGKKRSTLAQRYYVYKWSVERTLLG